MADPKPDSPELANLKERESILVDKLKRIEGLDANHQARGSVDVNEVKHRTNVQLTEIRKEIQRLSK